MKKDIQVPIPQKVSLSIIPQVDDIWDIYIVNENTMALKNILIVTEAYDHKVKSSTLRYFLESLDTLSGIKFESIMGDVMLLDNVVTLTYYIGADFYHKEFEFSTISLSKLTLNPLPIIKQEGYSIV